MSRATTAVFEPGRPNLIAAIQYGSSTRPDFLKFFAQNRAEFRSYLLRKARALYVVSEGVTLLTCF